MNNDRREFESLISKYAKLNERMGRYFASGEPSDSDKKTKTEEEIILVLRKISEIADLYIK